jgi:hypothetical protein
MPKWNEDQWHSACLHLLNCKQSECRACDRIKHQIDEEKFLDHQHSLMEGEGGIPQ